MIVTTGLVGWDKEPGLVNGQKEISKKKRRGKTMGDSITGSLSVGMSKKSLDEDIFDHLPDGDVIHPQEASIYNEKITKGSSV